VLEANIADDRRQHEADGDDAMVYRLREGLLLARLGSRRSTRSGTVSMSSTRRRLWLMRKPILSRPFAAMCLDCSGKGRSGGLTKVSRRLQRHATLAIRERAEGQRRQATIGIIARKMLFGVVALLTIGFLHGLGVAPAADGDVLSHALFIGAIVAVGILVEYLIERRLANRRE
jgi:hypothetical protein